MIDDSFGKYFKGQRIFKTGNRGRHRNVIVNYVMQNLFQQTKWSKTIDLNTTHFNLFNSLKNKQHLCWKTVRQQIFVEESYEFAAKQPF